MRRRHFLQLLSATAVTAAYQSAARAAGPSKHVVVIGAGILGAAISYHLAKRGVRVTVLEKTAPASGATGDSFAYLNASTKRERPYYELNLLGMAGWRRLQLELNGALPLQWGGAVYWREGAEPAQQLLATLRHYQGWGYAGRRIDEPELHTLLPNVTTGRIDGAVLYEQEGAIDPVGAVNVLFERAKALGAKVEFPVEVTGLDVSGDHVRAIKTSQGDIAADAVIVAAGLGSKPLIDALGLKLPLTASAGVLIHTAPQAPLLDRVAFAPGGAIKQSLDGRVVSSSSHDGSLLSLGIEAQGQQILKSAARFLPKLQTAQIERVSVGHRVLPEDGFPILGFPGSFRNLYVTVTHSGVTLAPIIAQFATQELLDGVSLEPLNPYRPQRFS